MCNVRRVCLVLGAVWWASNGEVCEVMLPSASRASVGCPALVSVPLGQVVLEGCGWWCSGRLDACVVSVGQLVASHQCNVCVMAGEDACARSQVEGVPRAL